MHIVASQTELAHALLQVGKAVEANNPSPVLSGILIKARSEGVSLAACGRGVRIEADLCIQSQPHCVRIVRNGEVVVSAKYLLDIVRKLPDGDVVLEVTQDFMLSIRGGTAHFRISGIDADQFPSKRNAEEIRFRCLMRNDRLKDMIRQVGFAASNELTRPVLTGVLFRFEGNTLQLTATDGVCLSMRKASIEEDVGNGNVPNAVIVPGKHLMELSKLIQDEHGKTEVSISGMNIRFRTGPFSLESALLSGTFPSIEPIIPVSHQAEVTLPAEALFRAVERVCLMSGDDRTVSVTVSEQNGIELASSLNEIGDVQETIPVERMEGRTFQAHFNGKYFAELIESFKKAKITMTYSGPRSPLLLQSEHLGALGLLTPILTRA